MKTNKSWANIVAAIASFIAFVAAVFDSMAGHEDKALVFLLAAIYLKLPFDRS
jgi:hypothetical protein